MTALILFFFLFPLPFLLWNIIDPRGMWEKLSSWQFRDPEANEPSDAAFDMQRLISLISLSVLVVGSLGLFSVVHRSADARSTPTSTRAPQVYPYVPSTPNGGRARTTVTPEPIDPFPSASTSPVGGGDPVTLFTPVLTDTTGGQDSESSQRIGVDAFYYPWMPDDHPSAFADADVIDSRVALSTLDPAQATTTAGGRAALGEGPAILVRMTQAVCAVTAVTVTELVGWEHSMKNELIIAMWTGHKKRSAAERLQALLAQFGLEALLAERFPALRV